MTNPVSQMQSRPSARSPAEQASSREQGLALARRRQAARRRRNGRIRKVVGTIALLAFLGPFGVIYTQLAAGRDPVLSTSSKASGTSSTVAMAPGSPSASASSVLARRRAADQARAAQLQASAKRRAAAAAAAQQAQQAAAAQQAQQAAAAAPAPVKTQQS
jgi:hypothetical protein